MKSTGKDNGSLPIIRNKARMGKSTPNTGGIIGSKKIKKNGLRNTGQVYSAEILLKLPTIYMTK